MRDFVVKCLKLIKRIDFLMEGGVELITSCGFIVVMIQMGVGLGGRTE